MKKVKTARRCTDCKYCVYANSAYICDLTDEIVIIDCTPTEHYCGGKDFEDEQR